MLLPQLPAWLLVSFLEVLEGLRLYFTQIMCFLSYHGASSQAKCWGRRNREVKWETLAFVQTVLQATCHGHVTADKGTWGKWMRGPVWQAGRVLTLWFLLPGPKQSLTWVAGLVCVSHHLWGSSALSMCQPVCGTDCGLQAGSARLWLAGWLWCGFTPTSQLRLLKLHHLQPAAPHCLWFWVSQSMRRLIISQLMRSGS